MTDPDPSDSRRENSSASPEGPPLDTAAESLPADGPRSPDLPGQQDVARRTGAALIDIVLLTGLLVIMSATVGHFSVGAGGFDFSLDGVWALVYIALLLVYFFTLEALTGQTVGKRVLGLRVLRTDGSRPSLAAIARRTVLRIVDWLPVLYLVGFITMMATGARRQRLGDLGAGTAVARALPARRRVLAFIPLALVLLAAAGLSVHRATSADTVTYHANGVSFDFPAAWQQGTLNAAGPGQLWSTGVLVAVPDDYVGVEADQQVPPITAANLGASTLAVDQKVRRFFEQNGGVVRARPERITMGGLPGLEFRGTVPSATGTPVAITLVDAFDGAILYQVTCVRTPANAAEIGRGCDQVIRTFKLG